MIYVNGRFLTQDITGVQRFALEISKSLSLLRNDLTFIVPSLESIKDKEFIKNFKVLELSGGNSHLWEQVTLPIFLLKNHNPLLLNLCNTAPVFYKNQIATHHDVTYIKYPQGFPVHFRIIYKLIAKLVIKNSKSLLTVSNFSKNEISDCYCCDKNKISVVYNAVNCDFKPSANTQNNKSDRYILAVSSTNHHKNFHSLIDAFISTNLNLKLKIIGGKAKNFKGIDLAVEDKRVMFLGRVSDQELIELYQNAEAFVFPSLYEGFGIPPLEAQACGCPVLSSNRASMPEVLNDSALFFDPESKMEIINSLNEVYHNDSIRTELKRKGFENIKRFSWDISAKKINEIINYSDC